MSATEILRLRHIATAAVLSLTLGVAACNEEGGDDGDQTGMAPTEPTEAPMDDTTPTQ